MAYWLPASSRLIWTIPPLAAPAMANAGGERDAGLVYGGVDTVVDKTLIFHSMGRRIKYEATP